MIIQLQQRCNMLFSLYVGVTLDDLCSPKPSGIPLLQRLPQLSIEQKQGVQCTECNRAGVDIKRAHFNTHWMTLMNVLQIFQCLFLINIYIYFLIQTLFDAANCITLEWCKSGCVFIFQILVHDLFIPKALHSQMVQQPEAFLQTVYHYISTDAIGVQMAMHMTKSPC